jgi:hypothetical protein
MGTILGRWNSAVNGPPACPASNLPAVTTVILSEAKDPCNLLGLGKLHRSFGEDVRAVVPSIFVIV